MKKLSKLVALATSLVAVTAFTIIGCSNFSSSDDDNAATVTTGATTRKSSANSIALEIGVTADSDLVKFSAASNDSARTITPDALDSSLVKFYLGGTDLVTNTPLTMREVTFVADASSTTKGTVVIDLAPSNYRFTLVALPKLKTTGTTTTIDSTGTTKADDDPTNFTTLSTFVTNAVLIGYANADLRYTTESEHINFKMTSDGLTGNGTLNLKFYLKGWSANSLGQRSDANDDSSAFVIGAAKIGLYNIRTGALITGSEDAAVDFTGKTSDTATVSYTGGSAASALPAGTYDVRVTFTRKNTQGVTKTYVFGDSIMILPGQVTEETLGIPDLLPLAPAKPASFTVGYLAPETGNNNDSDYYKVIFNWTEDDTDDASKVEQYFEIQLYEIPADAGITPETFKTAGENVVANWASSDGDTAAESATENTYRYNTNFYGMTEYYYYSGTGSSSTKNVIEKAPTWYCGSLQKDNHFAGFYLELGKRYLARIRAVNDVDKSAWEYAVSYSATGTDPAPNPPTLTLTKDIDVTRDESSISTTRTDTVYKFNTDIINLYRLKYELNGGSFTSGAVDQVYYFDQLKEGVPLMVPDGTQTISIDADAVNCATTKPYNGGSSITLKDSTGTQDWVSWKLWGADGTMSAYPNKFTKATTYAAGTTYYVTEDISASPDINGSNVGYKIAATQPTSITASDNYYVDSKMPTNYMGYKNLTLYANYKNDTTFVVEIANKADYRLESNVDFKVVGSGGGEGAQPIFGTAGVVAAYDSITVNRNGKDASNKAYNTTVLTFSWDYKADAVAKYDRLELTLDKQNKGGIYTYDITNKTAKVNVQQYESQSMITATLKAYTSSNPKAPYELPIYIRLN